MSKTQKKSKKVTIDEPMEESEPQVNVDNKREKVELEIKGENQHSATYSFHGEDHTLGNLLRN
jgi:hypothetical protein